MKKLSNLFICILFVFALTSCKNFFNNVFYADTTNDIKQEAEIEKLLGRVKWTFAYKNINNGFFQFTDLEKNLMDLNYDGTLIHGEYTVRNDGAVVFRENSLKYNVYLKDFSRTANTLTFQIGLCEDYSTINYEFATAKTDGIEPPLEDPENKPLPPDTTKPDVTDPTDPKEPTDTNPVDPEKPSDSVDPETPAEPTDPSDSLKPSDPTNQTDPSNPVTPDPDSNKGNDNTTTEPSNQGDNSSSGQTQDLVTP